MPLSLALSRGRRFEQTDLSGTEFDAATRLGCAVLYSATLDGRTQFPCPHLLPWNTGTYDAASGECTSDPCFPTHNTFFGMAHGLPAAGAGAGGGLPQGGHPAQGSGWLASGGGGGAQQGGFPQQGYAYGQQGGVMPGGGTVQAGGMWGGSDWGVGAGHYPGRERMPVATNPLDGSGGAMAGASWTVPSPHPPPPTPPVPPPAIEFVDSIRVTYGSMDRCGTAQLSRAEAEARCALRTRCQWILDYGCDGSSWRVCDWIKNMDPDPHSSSCSRVIATEVDRVPQYVHSWDNVDQWGPG